MQTAMINKIEGQPLMLSWGENSICSLQVLNQEKAACVLAKVSLKNDLPTFYFFLIDDLHLSDKSVIKSGNMFTTELSRSCFDDYERLCNDLQHIIVFTD